MMDVKMMTNSDVERVKEDLLKTLSSLLMGTAKGKTKVLIIVYILAEIASYDR
jgi:hypothetical protein